jgi:hypothetical protein
MVISGGVGLLLFVGGIGLTTDGVSGDLGLGIVWIPGGLFLTWMSVHSTVRRPFVRVTATQLCSRGVLGLTRRFSRSEIVSLNLGAKVLPRLSVPSRLPYVQLVDGTRAWLPALAISNVVQPVLAPQIEILHDLRTALGVPGADDKWRADGHALGSRVV